MPKVTQNAFGVYMIAKMLISLIPEYLSYFKADFHPSEIDYTDLVNHWKARLADEYDMDGFKPELKAVLYS